MPEVQPPDRRTGQTGALARLIWVLVAQDLYPPKDQDALIDILTLTVDHGVEEAVRLWQGNRD